MAPMREMMGKYIAKATDPTMKISNNINAGSITLNRFLIRRGMTSL